MGLLADLYLAHDDDAARYDTTPESFTDRAQFTSMTPGELSTLWAIMRGVEWDADILDQFACLLEVDGGERLIHRVPAGMLIDLVALSPDRVASVTAEWAATEELSCPPEHVRPIVDALVRLSRLAHETDRSLHLWNCI